MKSAELRSTDTSLKIYISEEERSVLFKEIDGNPDDIEAILSAENLERHCLGKTYLPDCAYSQIRRLLRQEYKAEKSRASQGGRA